MNNKIFLAAMYLRLSREDRNDGDFSGGMEKVRFESNSIANQRELIRNYIREQQDIELYDDYVDDGFSGSNFDRPEFKRMLGDIESGCVDCVIVKDLSRFGRDYIEAGRYIQRIFPALGVRFIALTDNYDSFHADASDSGIVLPVKNFINDSYCRDISVKVRSQFEVKRKKGECIAPFAPYGYRKSDDNKNQLVVDGYAADIVNRIFEWKIDGMAISAIAKRLNESGILSPKEYKKFMGSNYSGGFSGSARSLWGSSTVKRILTDETYLGHLIQGKTEKINYKLKKIVQKPKEERIKVEGTHEPVISEEKFRIVQNLLRTDGRISPVTRKSSLFAGILFCGDCGEQMIRRVNRYKGTEKVYYICSTKNRVEGCTRHSISEEQLKEIIYTVIRKYANIFFEEKCLLEKSKKFDVDFETVKRYDTEIAGLKRQQEKYRLLCSRLYEDLIGEVLTREEFERLRIEFRRKEAEFADAKKKQELLRNKLMENSDISKKNLKKIKRCIELSEIDRHTLCSMIKEIKIYENKRMEIEFYYADKYREANHEGIM